MKKIEQVEKWANLLAHLIGSPWTTVVAIENMDWIISQVNEQKKNSQIYWKTYKFNAAVTAAVTEQERVLCFVLFLTFSYVCLLFDCVFDVRWMSAKREPYPLKKNRNTLFSFRSSFQSLFRLCKLSACVYLCNACVNPYSTEHRMKDG